MPLNPPQASPVQDGLQRGINDNIASAGGPNNGYGNNMAPPAGYIAPNPPQASPLQNGLNTGMGNNMQPAGNMGQDNEEEMPQEQFFHKFRHHSLPVLRS